MRDAAARPPPSSGSTRWSRRTTRRSSSARSRSAPGDRHQRPRSLDLRSRPARPSSALVARAPRDRVVIAESGISTRAQGAAAELAGANAILVGSTLMRSPDPGAKLAELISRPLVKVCGLTRQEDVDAAAEAGADLVGFILASESPRRAPSVLAAPETVLSVASSSARSRTTDADLVQFYAREDGHRARDGALRRNEREVATVVDLPWAPGRSRAPRARPGDGRPGDPRRRPRPENVAEAIAAVRPVGGRLARSSLELEPGIKDHDLGARLRWRLRDAADLRRLRRQVRPETLIPALDELEAGWRDAQSDDGVPRRAAPAATSYARPARRRSRARNDSRRASAST